MGNSSSFGQHIKYEHGLGQIGHHGIVDAGPTTDIPGPMLFKLAATAEKDVINHIVQTHNQGGYAEYHEIHNIALRDLRVLCSRGFPQTSAPYAAGWITDAISFYFLKRNHDTGYLHASARTAGTGADKHDVSSRIVLENSASCCINGGVSRCGDNGGNLERRLVECHKQGRNRL